MNRTDDRMLESINEDLESNTGCGGVEYSEDPAATIDVEVGFAYYEGNLQLWDTTIITLSQYQDVEDAVKIFLNEPDLEITVAHAWIHNVMG